jgi:hypothetical protein
MRKALVMGIDLPGERTLARHPKDADLNDSLSASGHPRTEAGLPGTVGTWGSSRLKAGKADAGLGGVGYQGSSGRNRPMTRIVAHSQKRRFPRTRTPTSTSVDDRHKRARRE